MLVFLSCAPAALACTVERAAADVAAPSAVVADADVPSPEPTVFPCRLTRTQRGDSPEPGATWVYDADAEGRWVRIQGYEGVFQWTRDIAWDDAGGGRVETLVASFDAMATISWTETVRYQAWGPVDQLVNNADSEYDWLATFVYDADLRWVGTEVDLSLDGVIDQRVTAVRHDGLVMREDWDDGDDGTIDAETHYRWEGPDGQVSWRGSNSGPDTPWTSLSTWSYDDDGALSESDRSVFDEPGTTRLFREHWLYEAGWVTTWSYDEDGDGLFDSIGTYDNGPGCVPL